MLAGSGVCLELEESALKYPPAGSPPPARFDWMVSEWLPVPREKVPMPQTEFEKTVAGLSHSVPDCVDVGVEPIELPLSNSVKLSPETQQSARETFAAPLNVQPGAPGLAEPCVDWPAQSVLRMLHPMPYTVPSVKIAVAKAGLVAKIARPAIAVNIKILNFIDTPFFCYI